MKSLLRISVFIFILLCVISCKWRLTTIEYSGILQEEATVEDVVFTPDRHGSGMGPTVDFDGNMGMAFTSIDIPEEYAVVFGCQHGKFIIKNKALWEKLKRNQKVVVLYREIYKAQYERDTKKGKTGDQLIERRLTRLDFLNVLVDGKQILPEHSYD